MATKNFSNFTNENEKPSIDRVINLKILHLAYIRVVELFKIAGRTVRLINKLAILRFLLYVRGVGADVKIVKHCWTRRWIFGIILDKLRRKFEINVGKNIEIITKKLEDFFAIFRKLLENFEQISKKTLSRIWVKCWIISYYLKQPI